MSTTQTYRWFEVREGFGPFEVGRLDLQTISRTDAERRAEEMWAEGMCVQLFGIPSHHGEDGTRVLLRSLVAPRAAA